MQRGCRHTLRDFGGNIIKMGRLAPNHRTQANHGAVALRYRKLASYHRNFKAAGHPGIVNLLVEVNAVTFEGIFTARQELTRHQIVKAGNDDREFEMLRLNKIAFKYGHARFSSVTVGANLAKVWRQT